MMGALEQAGRQVQFTQGQGCHIHPTQRQQPRLPMALGEVGGKGDCGWLREYRGVQKDLGTAQPQGSGLGEPRTDTR
jgi:hypothetical protein